MMGVISSGSDLVNRLTGGNNGLPENIYFRKIPYIAGTIEAWGNAPTVNTAWLFEGVPAAAATPTTVVAPSKATTGAVQFANSGGTRDKLLIGVTANAPATRSNSMIRLYDRLLQIGGLSGTVTTAQTVGGTLTRNTGGVGNRIWLEIYSFVGSTPTTVTASYTNQAGTSGRTTSAVTFGGSSATQFNTLRGVYILPLQDGDTGVQAVASVTLAGSTGTAGNFGLVVGRPLASVMVHNGAGTVDYTIGASLPPVIDDDACLAFNYDHFDSVGEGPFAVMLTTVEA